MKFVLQRCCKIAKYRSLGLGKRRKTIKYKIVDTKTAVAVNLKLWAGANS